jgi:hypothetical protein
LEKLLEIGNRFPDDDEFEEIVSDTIYVMY